MTTELAVPFGHRFIIPFVAIWIGVGIVAVGIIRVVAVVNSLVLGLFVLFPKSETVTEWLVTNPSQILP